MEYSKGSYEEKRGYIGYLEGAMKEKERKYVIFKGCSTKKREDIWNSQRVFFFAKQTELDCVYLGATEATRRSPRAESGSYENIMYKDCIS